MEGLDKHLAKCEIEYIARHGGGFPKQLKGLSGDEIVAYLRSIGFRFKKRLSTDGEWICTQNNISVTVEPSEADPCEAIGFVVDGDATSRWRKRQKRFS